MANKNRYGISFPLSDNGKDLTFIDLNSTKEDDVRSKILHIMLTPKGQRLRMPDFGTNLIKAIYNPNEENEWSEIKKDISEQVSLYLPEVIFEDFQVLKKEDDDHSVYLTISYSIKKGNKVEKRKSIINL